MEKPCLSHPRGEENPTWRRPLGRLLAAVVVAVTFAALLLRVSLAQSGTGDTPPPPPAVSAESAAITATATITPLNTYVVKSGDTVFGIALAYSVTMEAIAAANQLENPDDIEIDQVLIIPEPSSETDPALTAAAPITDVAVISRVTAATLNAPITSPFYRTTWLGYYGRPGVPVMGIVGEHELPELMKLLKEQARVIDELNGPEMRVKPAYHLVYGMATVARAADNSHLQFLPEDVVVDYIANGMKNNIAVILDVQVGALSPSEAISRALPYLQYPNVHLAIDPEFAMSHPGQSVPGNPIGFITGAEINAAQELINDYMAEHKIRGRRMLLVHQFFDEMIVDKDQIDWDTERVDLVICADGFGDPNGKISKYNDFFSGNEEVAYTAFKLFYNWDEPLLTERQALGMDKYNEALRIGVAPNVLIYQ